MQSRSCPTGRVSSLGNRADRLGHLPPPCLSVPSASACQRLLWRRSRARLGQEEIPAGGVDSRAAGCVPRSQAVSGAPPCRAQDGGSRPPPICCEPGWRGSQSLGPGWGGASPGSSPCINPGPARAAVQWLLPLGGFLPVEEPSSPPPPVKGGSSVCCGNPPVGMWALLLRAAVQEQPLVRGLCSVEPSFVEGPVVGPRFMSAGDQQWGKQSVGMGSAWHFGSLWSRRKGFRLLQNPQWGHERAAFCLGGGLSCSKIWPRVGVQEGLVLGFLPLFSGRAESPWCFLSLEGSRPVSIQQTPELSLSLRVALSASGLACPICWHPVCPWGSALPPVPGTSLCAVCEPSSQGP